MIIPYLTQAKSSFFSKNNTGLGNALFQIFSAYGISKKFNHTFNNYYLLELLFKLNKLNLNHADTIFRNLKIFNNISNKNNIHLHEKRDYYALHDAPLTNKIKCLHDNNVIFLTGYFQSHLYFDEYYNDILKLIQPDENSLRNIKQKYTHLFDDTTINISLHFRLNWCHNLQYNNNFYNEAIEYMENILNNENNSKKIILNIFGDDISQIKNKFSSDKYNCIYFQNNMDYIDLWCMSLCRCNIISNSTLSWWGAYINIHSNKIVIYPEDLLRLLHAKIHDKPVLIERKIQHYKSEWIGLKTENVIFQ